MSGLGDIPVTVAESEPVSGQALAIAAEIADMVEALHARGETSQIDLRSLPMLPGDYRHLVELLGSGEVEATLDALGTSRIRDTAVPGVWWVTHYNREDEVMAELIEVTSCPAILSTPTEDLAGAANTLRQRMQEQSTPSSHD